MNIDGLRRNHSTYLGAWAMDDEKTMTCFVRLHQASGARSCSNSVVLILFCMLTPN